MFIAYFIIACIILYVLFTWNNNYWKNKGVAFIKPIPFLGNIGKGILMKKSIPQVFDDMYNKTTQPMVGFFVFTKPCLLIRDPKLAKSILVSDFHHFIDRNMANNKRDDPIGTHILLVLKNPDWKELRAKLTPIFSSAKIKNMSKLVEKAGDELVEYLTKTSDINPEIEIKNVCVRYTVDVITSVAFGIDAFSFKKKNSEFFTMAKRLTDWDDFLITFRMRCYFIAPSLVKLLRLRFLDPVSCSFLKKSFLDIMRQRVVSGHVRHDLIDLLLQIKSSEKQLFDDDILVAQAVTFFLAGFETTGSTMSFALFELAHHQEIQTKLRKEINTIFKKYGSINFDSIAEMEYLDMCFKEVLRKYPVLPFLDRQATSSYKIPGTDITIDKGTPVYIPIFSLQNDPQYFPNPHVFDPERFSKSNESHLQNCLYLPFGDGPRSCIGMRFGRLNSKLGLAVILKNFLVETTPDTPKSIQFNPKSAPLSSLKDIMLKMTKLNECS